ncbi:DUF1365 domain-containing protein [Aliiroseovarius sp. PTFE2010]|uniref:DUF1365 domain-containing protein n=1 Tax=Aliiroseovarius sp. PTFE2010 TaxID=3417190 RepID=UPI003CEAD131
MSRPEHIRATTFHRRRGDVAHSFSYALDYVLVSPDAAGGPALWSRDGWNVFSLRSRDYGSRAQGSQAAQGSQGAQGTQGVQGAEFARRTFRAAGVAQGAISGLRLITQPRVLGRTFNPVSFWLAQDSHGLRAVLAEVNNTFGDRHFYLCHKPDLSPLTGADRIEARKVMHVSPFQDIAGTYAFQFDVTDDAISIRIDFRNGRQGVLATLAGKRQPLTNRVILGAALRRPYGAIRTIALIYWQAVRLKLKGARYRTRPQPPEQEVSPCSSSPTA